MRAEPVIDLAVEPKTKADQEKLGLVLAQLATEDPTFRVNTDEESGQTILSGTSEVHLEGIIDQLRREFGVGTNIGAPQVAYREAITRTVEYDFSPKLQLDGSGHLARIRFRIEPNELGFEFVGTRPETLLAKQYTSDVRRGVESVIGSGPLIGFPIINVKFVLIAISGDDSSTLEKAGRSGFREALQKAGPKILEPFMSIEVTVPGNYVSDIIGDLNSRRAHIRRTADRGLLNVVEATVPMSSLFGYADALRALSNGRADHLMRFDHYEPVPPVHPYDGPYGGALAMRA